MLENLMKQLHKKCKYKYTMNAIPQHLAYNNPKQVLMPLKSINCCGFCKNNKPQTLKMEFDEKIWEPFYVKQI